MALMCRSDAAAARRRLTLLIAGACLAALIILPPASTASAATTEAQEIRIAEQYGLAYLPMIVVRSTGLIEKRAAAAGLPAPKVTWARLSGGPATNEALLAGRLDYAAAGFAPILILWDKTRGNLGVRAVGGLDASAASLNVNRPGLRSIADFTDRDRIALPAIKVSLQAILLQMAAEQTFGVGRHDALDRLTVALPHPEAFTALVSGRLEITAHFATPPFNFQELEKPGIRRIMSSHDLFGGPATLTALYATGKFVRDNPGTHRVVFDAFREASDLIARDPATVARIYVEAEKTSLDVEQVAAMLRDPAMKASWTPLNTAKLADFLHRVGTIKNKPQSWHDYFFPEIYDQPGS